MIIDIIAVILIVMAIFKGLRNGLVVAIFSLLAFVVGLTAAVKLSAVVAEYLGESVNVSQRWLPVLAFALVFIMVVLLVRIGAKAIEKVLHVAMLGWANRVGGVLLYIVLYFFIYSVVLFYAEQLHLIKEGTIKASLTYNEIKPLAPKITNALGWLLPFFKNMFAELESFFDSLANRKS